MQLRSPTLVGEYDYIYPADAALDQEADGFADLYRESVDSGKLDKVPMLDGKKPIVWRLKHLRGVPKRKIRDMVNHDLFVLDLETPREQTLYSACRFALVGVEGLTDHTGKNVEVLRGRDREWGNAMAVTPDFMDSLSDIESEGELIGDTVINQVGAESILRLLPGKR